MRLDFRLEIEEESKIEDSRRTSLASLVQSQKKKKQKEDFLESSGASEAKRSCTGLWVIIAVLMLIIIVIMIYFVTRWSDGRLISRKEETNSFGDGFDKKDGEKHGYEVDYSKKGWHSPCGLQNDHCHVCIRRNKNEPLPTDFIVMSTADVWANEAECIEAMPCDGSVALSDGRYDGPCLDSRLTAGNYLGCNNIQEILIMTDDGRPRQHLYFGAMCPNP